MSFLSFLPVIGNILDKIIGDKRERDDAKARIRELELRGQLEPLLRQIEVNIEEAKSGSLFIAGWRPMAAWMCVCAMGLGFITTVFMPSVFALIPLFSSTADVSVLKIVVEQLKSIDIGIYVSMLLGMLGLGTMRAYEKSRGINSMTLKEEHKVTADAFLRLYTKRFSRVTDKHREIIYQLFNKLESQDEE